MTIEVTPQMLREAAAAAGIKKVKHYCCPNCHGWRFYTICEGEVAYEAACKCKWIPAVLRTWQDVVDDIDCETNQHERNALILSFGVKSDTMMLTKDGTLVYINPNAVAKGILVEGGSDGRAAT